MKAIKKSEATSAKKRIFIVEDHPLTRHGLSQLINAEPGLMVCGEAESTQQALAAIKPPLPDLVLCDLTMPGQSGLKFIKDFKASHPAAPVLVISMHDENLYAERVLRAGGAGYIMKSAGSDKVLEAIHQVLQGHTYVSEIMAKALVQQFAQGRAPREDTQFNKLTDREFEVFQLVGQGLSTSDISNRLRISPKTVETHRMHIKKKFAMQHGAELTKHAVRWVTANQLI
jgi:DNA-binding NarL/FixJ family response regulator